MAVVTCLGKIGVEGQMLALKYGSKYTIKYCGGVGREGTSSCRKISISMRPGHTKMLNQPGSKLKSEELHFSTLALGKLTNDTCYIRDLNKNERNKKRLLNPLKPNLKTLWCQRHLV